MLNLWSCPFKKKIYLVVYLKIGVTERNGETKEGTFPSADSHSKWLQQQWLSQVEAKSLELHPGILCGWLGPWYLGQLVFHCFLSSISRELDWNWSSWALNWDPYGVLTLQTMT